MNCQEARKVVHLFVDGAMDPRENVDVLAHLNMCGACNERFAEAKRFEDFLKEKLKAGPAPDGLKDRISARLGELAAPWPVRLAAAARRHPVVPVSAAAAFLFASFLGWQAWGASRVCPYVAGATEAVRHTESLTRAPERPEGPLKTKIEATPFPVLPGMIPNGTFLVSLGPHGRDVVARSFRMENCCEDRQCMLIFFVEAPGLSMGDHDCIVKQGRKFNRWEHEGCHAVCWKDEKRGLYCVMLCQQNEMDADALANYADLAATQ